MAKIPTSALAVLATKAYLALLVSSQNRLVQSFATPPIHTHTTSAPSSSSNNRSTSSSHLEANKRQGNPFTSLIGDMASSVFSTATGGGGGIGGDTALKVNQSLKDSSSCTIQSWEDVKSNLVSKQTPEEKAFRSNVEKGIGQASPLNKIRLFDESNKEKDVRVTLYRDHASWCPYCQKVWMTLEEKRIPYKVEKVNMRCYGDKESSFLRLQPNGNIPVAVIDGSVYNQSNDIIFALEQLFPDHQRLLPPVDDNEGRMKVQELMRLERDFFSAWMYWLTGNGGDRSKNAFVGALREVEGQLKSSKGGDFFLGEKVSIVDMLFAPFIERMCASLLFFKGFKIRVAKGEKTEFVAVNKWFDAMEKLESYQLTKSDYYTHCWDLPPQLGGCTYESAGEPYEKAINGERSVDGSQGSWDLPLQPNNGGVEPDWDWCGDEGASRREAAERLSFNQKNIVAFAARGAGRKGMPGYSAALSDPNAVANDAVKESVDACLRLVSLAMLDTPESVDANAEELAEVLSKEGGKEFSLGVVDSLAYLRDRVGVPRDMRLPAARQLRSHLNWMIGKIISKVE